MRRRSPPPLRSVSIALAAILLIAWSTRIHRLDALSLWVDEGFTAYHASQPLGDLLASLASADNHPPFHYVALYFWTLLTGTSDYALRLFSAMAGTLTVAVMARLGQAFGSRPLGLLAALLLAISPFHVWYSQEVRMYALLALLGSIALLSLMLALSLPSGGDIPTANRRRMLFGAYALTMGTALLTHYYAFFLLPVGLALLLLSGHRRALGGWLVACSGALLLFSPWAPTLWSQYRRGTPGYSPEATPPEVLAGLWRSFAAGENTSAGLSLSPSLLAAALVGAVLVRALVQREERPPVAWLAVWCLLPVATALLLGALLRVDLRATGRMYYIAALPAFLLLVAWGALSLVRLHGLLLTALLPLLGVTVLSLQEQFLLQGKEDFRGAVARLEREAWPEDAIIINAEHIYPVFLHYYRGPMRWFRAEVGNEDATDRWLRRVTRGREFVWLLASHTEFSDPLGRVRGWFDSKGLLVTEQWYPGIRLASYALGPRLRDGPPTIETTQPVAYERGLRLEGFRLAAPQPGSGRLQAALVWHPEQRLAEDYRSQLMVFDAAGRLWAQDDRVSLAEASPSSTWVPGSYLVDRHTLPLPPGMPPGTYQVGLRVYAMGSGRTLEPGDINGKAAGGRVVLGTFELTEPVRAQRQEALRTIESVLQAPLGPTLEILGASVGREATSGEEISLTVLWQALQKPSSVDPRLILLGSGPEALAPLVLFSPPTAPPTSWSKGDLVRSQHTLRLPASLAAGPYRLVGLPSPELPPSRGVVLASLDVKAPERIFEVPEIPVPQTASFADHILLLGYGLDESDARPGGSLLVTLFWQARSPGADPLQVFTHLLDGAGRLVAQHDGPPLEGRRPTSGWLPGEVLVDDHRIPLPPEVEPGAYRLAVGLYRPNTGIRVEVLPLEVGPIGNQVLLNRAARVGP